MSVGTATAGLVPECSGDLASELLSFGAPLPAGVRGSETAQHLGSTEDSWSPAGRPLWSPVPVVVCTEPRRCPLGRPEEALSAACERMDLLATRRQMAHSRRPRIHGALPRTPSLSSGTLFAQGLAVLLKSG